ncbi:MAG: hypothetical protein GEU28_02675 [Dehalococcoidia bacterium]|nr:hypothetical protein [Dehalococcoidia bacterium]
MPEVQFPLDIAIIFVAALIGGLVAQALRLPVIVGYIAAGIVFGPETPGIDLDAEAMQEVAELGVVLLMFALGIEFSLKEASVLGQRVPIAAVTQVFVSVLLGLLLIPVLDLGVPEALFVGGILATSSTFVAIKLLDDIGEVNATSGKLVVAFSLVQDLTVIALVTILPELSGEPANIPANLATAIALGAAFLVVTYVLGVRVVPPIFEVLVRFSTREIFLLAVLALGLGTALAAEQAGLSVAFGAFLAGLVVSESRYGLQTLAQTLPLRDLFAIVFFVALGMLIPPQAFLEAPLEIAAVALLVIIAKGGIIAGLSRWAGFSGSTSVVAGVTLGQIGEFSFVFALVGIQEGIISSQVNGVVLSAVLVSILIAAVVAPQARRFAATLQALPGGTFLLGSTDPVISGSPGDLLRHAVICGYGRAGQELARALRRREFGYLVVENDPAARRRAEADAQVVIFGDASSPSVLQHCALDRARVLAITFDDGAAAELALANALQINARLDVIVRGRGPEGHRRFIEMGARDVIHPEVEGGLEFVRHALRRYGVPQQEILAIIAARRREFFGA